ncbi:purine nucleoside phosphorylase-like [Chironomus tepperi]|uniref:purine nucleoside phosphorylase-like n=1 Tax=Chironomus tepperi TaxID=113505 RepID=UPI00391F6400
MPEETKLFLETPAIPITGKKPNSYSSSSVSPRTSSPTLGENYSYDTIEEIAKYLLSRTHIRPKIGIICGSGLGHLGETLDDATYYPYEEIPHFPVSTVVGHAGRMVFGTLNGVEVMVMQGRFHYYEGYPLTKCSMPVRVMKVCGCTHLITTNAAGGLNPSYKIGDMMFVKDHINVMGFAGNNPLQGPNDPRFGPRFPPMNRAYDPELIKVAEDLSKEMGLQNETHTGVYICLGGPSYETVSELRMWKMLGVDAVGMSTVHEVITARHCDLKVFAFSLITNKCITDYDSNGEANHEEVISAGAKRQDVLATFVTRMVEKINEKM